MKALLNFLIMALVVTAFNGCEKYPSFAVTEKAFVDKSTVILYVGENVGEHNRTKITASPKDVSYRWESISPDVAEVDQNGNITAKTLGITTIRIYSQNDITDVVVYVREWHAFQSFTVVTEPVYNKNFMDLFQIGTVVFVPENQTEIEDLVWMSDDPSIAKVYPYGWVRCFDPGRATISASYGGVKQTIIINVAP